MSSEKKPLTREEEADEIIRRLSTPPKKRRLTVSWDLEYHHGLDVEKELMETLAAEIAAEIDKEIIATITSCQKNNPFTSISLDNRLVKVITLPSLIITPCIYVPSKNLILR